MSADINQQRKVHLPKIIFHLAVAAAFGATAWFWVFGSVYPAFEQRSQEVVAQIGAYQKLSNGDIGGYDDLAKLLGNALPPSLALRQSDTMALVTALKDPNGGFLQKAQAAAADIQQREEGISRQREVLGNIIPTITSESSEESFERGISNKMDLKRLTQYMEDQFYRSLNISEISSVGLDGIRFEPVEREQYKIGTFSMSLSFKDLTSFQKLLNMFSTTGVIPLTPEGTIDEKQAPSSFRLRGNVPAGYAALNNPLITVEQLSVSNYLDPAKRALADGGVTGNATVRFHVRTLDADETATLSNALREFIAGAKDDPTKQGLAKSVAAELAKDEEGVKAACDGDKRETAACPLNDNDFVLALNGLRDLNKTVSALGGAVDAILSKKEGRGEVATTSALNDAYRRVNAVDARFKELRSQISAKLNLK